MPEQINRPPSVEMLLKARKEGKEYADIRKMLEEAGFKDKLISIMLKELSEKEIQEAQKIQNKKSGRLMMLGGLIASVAVGIFIIIGWEKGWVLIPGGILVATMGVFFKGLTLYTQD